MSKNIEKMDRLNEIMPPLIGKVVYCDGNLFKIKDYSLLKLSGDQYECDRTVKVNTEEPFTCYSKPRIYQHFKNNVINKKFKMLNSSFRHFRIINNIDDIDDKYFIIGSTTIYKNYHTSNFKNDKLQFKQDINGFISSMMYGHMSDKTNTYYYKARKEHIKKHFNRYGFNKYKDEIKQLISKSSFIFYLKLYIEYKQLFLNEVKETNNNLQDKSLSLIIIKTEKQIKELKDKLAILRNEEDDSDDSEDSDIDEISDDSDEEE